jgi:hypothetical protein
MAKKEKKLKTRAERKAMAIKLAILFSISLTLCIVSSVLWPEDNPNDILFFSGTMLGLFGSVGFSIPLVITVAKIWGESVVEKARLQQAEEDARLEKIRETMTPAEWEAYKLQLENNKLLKQINSRGKSKGTTTTYGFVEGD